MILFTDKKDCCGCTACAESCPRGAITMTPDPEKGFLYPVIDQTACIGCGICKRVCPMHRADHCKTDGFPEFYMAKHRETGVRMASTSGGAFTALSDAMLARGGVIYGALWDEHWRVVHGRAEDAAGRDKMRVSKYVQSDLWGIFKQVKADLRAGREVLFTGTPCQTAGLRSYIARGSREDGEKLVLCDLLCYGVPSPRIWEDYKALLRAEHPGATNFRFRTKQIPWSRASSNLSFFFSDGAGQDHNDSRFYELFFNRKCISRESCGACPYCDTRRPSDLTIADYWGVEKYAPEQYDPTGVSVILCSTEKGAALLKQAESALHLERRDPAEQLAEQGRLHEPVPRGEGEQQFWEDLKTKPLAAFFEEE